MLFPNIHMTIFYLCFYWPNCSEMFFVALNVPFCLRSPMPASPPRNTSFWFCSIFKLVITGKGTGRTKAWQDWSHTWDLLLSQCQSVKIWLRWNISSSTSRAKVTNTLFSFLPSFHYCCQYHIYQTFSKTMFSYSFCFQYKDSTVHRTSAKMKCFTCTSQYGSHYPCVTTEPLKGG